MKTLLLTAMVSTLMIVGSTAVFAQDNTDMGTNEIQSPYMQAYDLCSKLADEQEVTDNDTGESNWNNVFETCMQDKGVSQDSGHDETSADESYNDDGSMMDQ